MLDYVTGASPEPVALLVATYLDLNPQMRASYLAMNSIGGAVIERVQPARLNDGGLAQLLERLDGEVQERPQLAASQAGPVSRVPAPLRPYVGNSWDDLPWKRWTSGVEEYVLETRRYGYRSSLLRISPGKALPQHTHAGDELTLVLDGAYTDEGGLFTRGGLEMADTSVSHRPVADADTGCVCLAILSAPVQLTGMLGWIVNPFIHH